MIGDSIKLRRRLDSLPQELYDDIYNYTFTASSSARIIEQRSETRRRGLRKLRWLQEVPNKRSYDGADTISLLLVDRVSHDQFVKSLYSFSGAVFVFKSPPACKIWLSCLKQEYLDMVTDIRCCARGRYVAEQAGHHLALSVDTAALGKLILWSERWVLRNLNEFEGVRLDD